MVQALLIICNLFILETLLSVDNAAALAFLVKDLPDRDRSKALRYGIAGAFIFRGISLFCVSWLIKLIWLKIVGAGWLLWLLFSHFHLKDTDGVYVGETKRSKVYTFGIRLGLNRLWSTIILVELMDMTFSIDNIFAAVALSKNIWYILAGVFMGIIAMRFVASWFVRIMRKYPSLEDTTFIVIGLLGGKLLLSGIMDYFPEYDYLYALINSPYFDLCFSGLIILIFILSVITYKKSLHAVR